MRERIQTTQEHSKRETTLLDVLVHAMKQGTRRNSTCNSQRIYRRLPRGTSLFSGQVTRVRFRVEASWEQHNLIYTAAGDLMAHRSSLVPISTRLGRFPGRIFAMMMRMYDSEQLYSSARRIHGMFLVQSKTANS
jgi:hypothetical protein